MQWGSFTTETLVSAFIPNTYQVYWDTDAEAFLERMIKEHKRFWDSNNRREKAKQFDA